MTTTTTSQWYLTISFRCFFFVRKWNSKNTIREWPHSIWLSAWERSVSIRIEERSVCLRAMCVRPGMTWLRREKIQFILDCSISVDREHKKFIIYDCVIIYIYIMPQISMTNHAGHVLLNTFFWWKKIKKPKRRGSNRFSVRFLLFWETSKTTDITAFSPKSHSMQVLMIMIMLYGQCVAAKPLQLVCLVSQQNNIRPTIDFELFMHLSKPTHYCFDVSCINAFGFSIRPYNSIVHIDRYSITSHLRSGNVVSMWSEVYAVRCTHCNQ